MCADQKVYIYIVQFQIMKKLVNLFWVNFKTVKYVRKCLLKYKLNLKNVDHADALI